MRDFSLPLQVTLYDLDRRDHVSCATLLRYFEETAMRASSALGFTLEWYRSHQQFWVIRTMRLERNCAARYEDQVIVRTWVSSMTRLRADRNYEMRRTRDNRLLARAVANWVYLDAHTLMPFRIAPELVAEFQELQAPILTPLTKLTWNETLPPRFEMRTHRRVQLYEVDSARHVNNAVYADWLEESVHDALCEMGFVLALDGATPGPWFCRHSLEYVRAALPGDQIEIHTRLLKRGQTTGSWEHQVFRLPSHELLLRAASTTIWLDSQDRPVSWQTAFPSWRD